MELEHVVPIDIAHADGRLRREAVGWARHPILRCNLAPGLPRAHAFSYWCIMDRRAALSLLVADVGLAGVALVSFLELGGAPVERVHARPLGLSPRLPDAPDGDFTVEARRLRLSLRHDGPTLRFEGEARTLLGRRLELDVTVVRPPGHETVNVLVPWDDTRFHLTSKQQALPARGEVRVDGRAHRFEEAYACLDFGRGRRPDGIEWCWAFAAGRSAGRTIGLNLGARWTDGTGVTENAVIVDGRVHKIADAVEISVDPWRIRAPASGRVDLRFTPRSARIVRVPFAMRLHQHVGVFSGTVAGDDGGVIEIRDLPGLAEWLRARWA